MHGRAHYGMAATTRPASKRPIKKISASRVVSAKQGQEPFVSVVIPCYNAEKTLRGCLQSVVEQAYPRYEIIVVDDGSKDSSSSILREFKNRITIVTQSNQGASAARNAGISAAKGEIILLLDTDARVFPEWISAHAMRQKEGYSILGGSVIPWDDGFAGMCDYYSTWYEYYPQKKFQTSRHQISSTNLSIHRRVIETAGAFDASISKRLEDVEFSIRVQRKGFSIAFDPAMPMAHHDRETLWGFLKHQYWYGRLAPFVRTKKIGARFAWLIPETPLAALLMIPVLALLHTGFVLYHWLPARPEAILFSPFILASKVAHAIGVYDGVKEKAAQKINEFD